MIHSLYADVAQSVYQKVVRLLFSSASLEPWLPVAWLRCAFAAMLALSQYNTGGAIWRQNGL